MRYWLMMMLMGHTLLYGQGMYRMEIRPVQGVIKLDGSLDEADWESAMVADRFFQNFPFDTAVAVLQTEVRVLFDEHFLYVGAILQQQRSDYIVASLKRDFEEGSSDEFAVNIDPFSDKINGFHFAVTPFNVQREGLIDNGENINADWDNKWYSRTTNTGSYWTVEMAIPFKTLRYKIRGTEQQWRIGFSRNAVKQNERSSWVPTPRQFSPNNLAFAGVLSWAVPPPAPGLNVSVIPFLAAGTTRDDEFRLSPERTGAVGGDIKIALTPSLNLDLTYNPDFSQVEVDRQLTNLSRFELFFPERRQFFLENEDLFSRFGFPNSRPFFSRRIGLARGRLERTTTDGQVISVERQLNVPIQAGARLSGKLDNNWRVGLLNMQSAAVDDIALPPANYSVGVLQRKVFDRSYVGAVMVNKEQFMPRVGGGYTLDRQAYNRVVGLEYNLFSKDNKWEAEAYYHRSISAGDNRDAQSAALFAGRFTREWRFFLPVQYVGSNFRADAGFVPRTGFLALSPGLSRNFFPTSAKLSKWLISYGLDLDSDITYNTGNDIQLVDRRFGVGAFAELAGQSRVQAYFSSEYTYLFFPFDPTNSGAERLPAGSAYRYNTVWLTYRSDFRKALYYEVEGGIGTYFNGNIRRLNGALNYRLQPYGTFALQVDYNDIALPLPYNSAQIWLIGPRAELAFSRDVFFSLFLQYNTQANNVNINGRLQWRFRPVSDIYLVYTDNYFAEGFFQSPLPKNRGLLLKLTYWLNL
jgi:hypothetical protein